MQYWQNTLHFHSCQTQSMFRITRTRHLCLQDSHILGQSYFTMPHIARICEILHYHAFGRMPSGSIHFLFFRFYSHHTGSNVSICTLHISLLFAHMRMVCLQACRIHPTYCPLCIHATIKLLIPNQFVTLQFCYFSFGVLLIEHDICMLR